MKFSLVVPCYKNEKELPRCLDSIQDQDYKNYEVIVVFDGPSTEYERFVKAYPEITFIELPENKGACTARNVGASLATGDVISFFSSDFYMKPGILRVWKNEFEKNPKVDYLYSGYEMFTDKPGRLKRYSSEPKFDGDTLMMRNFIDGGMPIRTKRLKAKKIIWDEELKSLNDWEFFVNVHKSGLKGKFIEDIPYIAEPPKEGGLSFDSNKNWVDRCKYIWDKHNIPHSKINIISLSAPFHAKRLAKLINAHNNDSVLYKKMDDYYTHIHVLGCFKSNIQVLKYMMSLNKKCKFTMHWIGSDIEEVYNGMSHAEIKELKKFLLNDFDKMYTEYEPAWEKLNSCGIKTTIQPLPVERFEIDDVLKHRNTKFTCAVYAPDKVHPNKYMTPMMRELAEATPMFNYIFFGNRQSDTVVKQDNVIDMGWVDIKEVMKKSDCLIRITPTDGLSITTLEYLNHGKPVITNSPVDGAHVIEDAEFDTFEHYDEVLNNLIDTVFYIESEEDESKPAKEFNPEIYKGITFRKEVFNV